MITVNLLPEQLRIKRKDFNFPIFPLLFLIYMVLLIVFAVIQFGIVSTRSVVQEMENTLLTVGSKSLEAQRLEGDVKYMQEIKEQVLNKALIPTYSLTMILDTINRNIPDNMWLTEIFYQYDGATERLKIHGFVRPEGIDTMITVIGDFNSALKEAFEAQLEKTGRDKGPVVMKKGVPVQTPKTVDFTMTTKRQKAENIEVTEFTTVFTL